MSMNKFLLFALCILSITSLRLSFKKNKTKKYYKICKQVNKTLQELQDVQDALNEINDTIIRKNEELTNKDEEVLATQKKIFAYYQNAINNMKTLIAGESLVYKAQYFDDCMKKVQEIEDATQKIEDYKNSTKMLQKALDKLIKGDY